MRLGLVGAVLVAGPLPAIAAVAVPVVAAAAVSRIAALAIAALTEIAALAHLAAMLGALVVAFVVGPSEFQRGLR